MTSLNIVVIGSGMYATGRGTREYGTVLPAITEWERSGGNVGKVVFVGTNGRHSAEADEKCIKLSREAGVSLDVKVLPQGGTQDPYAYRDVIANIQRPACAIVVVPDHLHFEITRDCLLSDLPALVVKPLTPTVDEGRKLINIANERNLYGAVEFHKRWDRANLIIKDTIETGRIGKPLYCWIEYSQRKTIPTEVFRAWSSRTSILQYLGIHYIDIIYFLTQAKPERVMAIGQKNWLLSKGIDTWDSIQCIIEWRLPTNESFVQTILTNWIDPETTSAMSDQKIKIVGTEGRIESDQKERGIRISVDGHFLEQPNPDFCASYGTKPVKQWRGYGIDSITTFFSDISEIFAGEITASDLKNSRPTFANALVSTAVVEAAHKSLNKLNSWQIIEDVH